MNVIKAIFIKQLKDMSKNPMVLVMFLVFPGVAFLVTIFMPENDMMPANMIVNMMAAIFAGMGLITAVSAVISEDIEQRSLRFLIIAGVKPYQYLIGTSGVFLIAGAIVSVVFVLIGSFSGIQIVRFLAVMITGTAASIMLGTVIGMWSKNSQTATSLGMPVAVIVGFAPMLANFNETIERFAGVLYTQQINVVTNDYVAGLAIPMLVIAANIAVFITLFIVAYRIKGLKG
jgi:ABC-2 type transport system permease protein